MSRSAPQTRVSVLALPDAMMSTLSGMYDSMNCFQLLGSYDSHVPGTNPFQPEIVAARAEPIGTASGLPVAPHRTIDEVDQTDIVILPSLMVEGGNWTPGRYPELVSWLIDMHDRGAILCSACSGVLLLAETGLLDGREATMHWAYARTFRENYPNVRLSLEKVLIATGDRQQFVMSGASASWHDLVLYLIARHAGPTAAQAIAKFLLLQWHVDGQAPYVVFEAPTTHGDAAVREMQDWLETNYTVAAPVDEMVRRSGLPERSFKRRFTKATGLTPIAYVQHLRIEDAKRRLERTETAIDEISWAVGYEDPAFFRRLFKRLCGLTPGAYRRKFGLPQFAAVDGQPPRHN